MIKEQLEVLKNSYITDDATKENKNDSCGNCAEKFRFGVPCSDIDKECPYKKGKWEMTSKEAVQKLKYSDFKVPFYVLLLHGSTVRFQLKAYLN